MGTQTATSIARRWLTWTAALVLQALVLASPTALAQPLETSVPFAILVDYQTGTVLFQKNADTPMPPASMAKLMTMAVLFHALRDGEVTLEDTFRISEYAWRTGGAPSGGATMFAELGSSVRVIDLMRGVIIQSGNDAAIAIAEGLAGTERIFAQRMNQTAMAIGLTNSVFTNSTGLPDPDQHVTARDLATLAAYIIREFPEYYEIYSERSFTWNNITQSNRNPLLTLDVGADGMKTGHTSVSGYGLVASTLRDGRRLVAVINGAETETERAREARAILEWGHRNFRMVSVFQAGEVVAQARVYGGTETTVGLRVGSPFEVLLPLEGVGVVEARVIYDGPVPAPITAGRPIGAFVLLLDDAELARAPLYADRDVEVGPLPRRALHALGNLLGGLW
jgi:serine-type D-Ala-D-Ala carboxypeptidase (penicillin-binding protein 5/6)